MPCGIGTPASTHPAVAQDVTSIAALVVAGGAAAADDVGMMCRSGVYHFVAECHVLAGGSLLWRNETGCHVWHTGR